MRRASIFAFLASICIPGLALAAEGAAQVPKLELKPCTDVTKTHCVSPRTSSLPSDARSEEEKSPRPDGRGLFYF